MGRKKWLASKACTKCAYSYMQGDPEPVFCSDQCGRFGWGMKSCSWINRNDHFVFATRRGPQDLHWDVVIQSPRPPTAVASVLPRTMVYCTSVLRLLTLTTYGAAVSYAA